ncbi:MAG: type II toxin-antitoxin system ParD family antitoxin [Planctomycetota bacterium]
MGKNTSISLGEHFERFIEAQVESGRYGSRSEVVREALRGMEQQEQHVEALRAALREGEKSGPYRPLDIERVISSARRKARRDA